MKDLIAREVLVTGQMLPSEWELADLYNVSRLTVRRAIDELVRQNWLSRRRGVGTFVSRPFRATIAASKLSFTEQMKAIGRRPSSRVLSVRQIPAPTYIAQKIQISEGEALVEISRLRLADDVPILYEIAYLPGKRFPGLENYPWGENDSLYHILQEHYGVVVTGLDHTIKPALLSPREATYFMVEPAQPALVSEIIAYAQDGTPMEYSWSISNGDKGEFYFRFRQIEATPD